MTGGTKFTVLSGKDQTISWYLTKWSVFTKTTFNNYKLFYVMWKCLKNVKYLNSIVQNESTVGVCKLGKNSVNISGMLQTQDLYKCKKNVYRINWLTIKKKHSKKHY